MSNVFMVNVLTDSNFEKEVLESTGIVLVDFWADWCGPCKQFAPTFEAVASKFQGKANFFKMNVEETAETAEKMNIRGLPSVLVFKDGKLFSTLVGNNPKEKLEAEITKALS